MYDIRSVHLITQEIRVVYRPFKKVLRPFPEKYLSFLTSLFRNSSYIQKRQPSDMCDTIFKMFLREYIP